MYDRRPGMFQEEVPPAPGRRVDATVKWFNSSKGFGFVTMADGTPRSFGRDGDVPKVVIKDPLAPHKQLLPTYTDTDIHNVTAYLATIK